MEQGDGHVGSAMVTVWNTSTGSLLGKSVGPLKETGSPALGPDQPAVTQIAFIKGTDQIGLVLTPTTPPESAAYAPSAVLQVWDWSTGEKLVDATLGKIQEARFNHTGSMLATFDSTRVRLWTVSSAVAGPAVKPSRGFEADSVGFSTADTAVYLAGPDAATKFTVHADNLVQAHSTQIYSNSSDYGWAVDPSLDRLAATNSAGIGIYDFDTGKLTAQLPSQGSATHILGFVPGAHSLLTWDGTQLRLVDVASGDATDIGPASQPVSSGVVDDPEVAIAEDGLVVDVVSKTSVTRSVLETTLTGAIAAVCRDAGRTLTRAEWAEYVPGFAYQDVCGR